MRMVNSTSGARGGGGNVSPQQSKEAIHINLNYIPVRLAKYEHNYIHMWANECNDMPRGEARKLDTGQAASTLTEDT